MSFYTSSGTTMVCELEGGLLKSTSTFPYFMLVALEGGGILRGLLLLLLYPLICCVGHEVGIRAMVMVCFCGVRVKGFSAGRAVLPKFFMEDVGLEGFEVLKNGGRRGCAVSRMPRVMVEGFLKEYLDVEVVGWRELKVFAGFYTGLIDEQVDSMLKERLASKEIRTVGEAEKKKWQPLPREKYPRPLVFHDGRIAFRPDPISTIAFFIWLPAGLLVAILRMIVALTLPYKLSSLIHAITGMTWRVIQTNPTSPPSPPSKPININKNRSKGQLYVCNHKTLFDPISVSATIDKPVTTVVYSLSRFSEVLSPIKTVRVSRDREEDRRIMQQLLSQGEDLVVCPEGTTCREPYLLRFSPLFAELADEVVPVAIDVHVTMFYATTARGFKWLDPFYYLMNPTMRYEVELLEKVETASVRVGKSSGIEMANYVQEVIGRTLGFECTKLTRKDKYKMLAGHEGIVTKPT